MFNRLQKLFHKSLSVDELLALSKSASGYDRERAVRKMREKRDAIFLDALIVRVNDWVPQVRDLARETIRELMTDDNREAFIERLDHIWQLKKKGRADHVQLINDISQFVLQNGSQEKLVEKVKSENKSVARVAYELLSEKMSPQELIQLALLAKDAIIIKRGAAYLGKLSDKEFDDIFERMINSSNAYLRCVVLQVGMRKSPERIKASYVHMLIDNTVDIRLVSINFFKSSGFNVKEFYLEHLLNSSKAKVKANAILGLGQARCADCAEPLRPCLSHHLVSIREAAFRTLYSFIPNDAAVRNLVLDRSPRVSKTAIFLVRRNENKVSFDELMKWFASAPTHAIRGLLRLARQSGKWNELILILKSWRKVPELYSLALKDWLNIFNIQQELPTTEQVLTIQGLRQTILEDIDQDTLDLLRFTLKPFKIIV